MDPPADSSSSRESDAPTSARAPARAQAAHLCEVVPLIGKCVRDEVRAQKDLRRLADSATVLLDVASSSAGAAIDACLAALVADGQLPASGVADAKRALVGRAARPRRARAGEDAFDSPATTELPLALTDGEGADDDDDADWHWRRHVSGAGFIVPFAGVGALDERPEATVVALARLAAPARLGVLQQDELTRYVAVVLAPAREVKETKGAFETARTLAAALADDDFRGEFRRAKRDADVRVGLRTFLNRQVAAVKDVAAEALEGEEDVFSRTGRFAGGLINDIKRRYSPRSYASDWTDGVTDVKSLIKYLSTVVWLYFAIIMPTIAFGALNSKHTKEEIGVIETIISQAIAGSVFAIFAGQPLTIVMTTAPLTVFIDVLYRWCVTLKIPFLPFYAWTGFWTALILLVLVVTDACFVMKYCGHFTEEIFAMLIAALFIGEFFKPLSHLAEKAAVEIFLLAFVLATGTYFIASGLLSLRRSFLLRPLPRQLLGDFGIPIAIVVMSAVRKLFPTIPVDTLEVPSKIGLVTTSGRAWIVPIFQLKVQYILLSLVSGLLLATLFFLDQNISSILVNRRENKLKKGPGYNLDLVVVAVIIVLQSIFGMPWTHAALPHSPLHARQLADVEEYEAHGRRYERVVRARETRITGFATHVLVALSILMADALRNIPLAVLYGFFLFLGIGTLDGNAMWDRMLLLFTQPEKYPPNHYVRRVPIRRIHLYTTIQFILLVLLWLDKSNFYAGDTVFNTGLLFPFIIAMFIPIRLCVLPRIFTPGELHALSMEEEVNISDTGATV